jgi:hypothetical protein
VGWSAEVGAVPIITPLPRVITCGPHVKLNGHPDLPAINTITEKTNEFFVILRRAYHTKLVFVSCRSKSIAAKPVSTLDITQREVHFIFPFCIYLKSK